MLISCKFGRYLLDLPTTSLLFAIILYQLVHFHSLLRCCRPLLGMFVVMSSSLLFCLTNVMVKATPTIDPFTMATARFVGMVLPCIPIVIYYDYDPFPKRKDIIIAINQDNYN